MGRPAAVPPRLAAGVRGLDRGGTAGPHRGRDPAGRVHWPVRPSHRPDGAVAWRPMEPVGSQGEDEAARRLDPRPGLGRVLRATVLRPRPGDRGAVMNRTPYVRPGLPGSDPAPLGRELLARWSAELTT